MTDPARAAAYRGVRAVTGADAYANLVLPGLLAEAGLTGRDAALATELCYGTLRRLGTLDLVLAAATRRDVARLDADVLDVLRLGAYQVLYTRVPAHAAVTTSVDLAHAGTRRGRTVGGLVNAALRRVAELDLAAWLTRVAPDPDTDPLGHLAAVHSHPPWIVEALHDALGGDWAEVERALAADNERPAVHLVARPGRISREDLLAESGGEAGPWSPYAVRLRSGDPAALGSVRQRRAAVQDEGSQLVALAAAAVPVGGGPDARWLDMCAGPGGKAALWGALAEARGAQVTAVERAAHRARLVRRTTVGMPVEVRVGDATDASVLGAPGTYDRVLLDAPCSGLGALRRRPEARWRRTPGDVAELAGLQDALLAAALRACRPGGVVAYVTCSPHLAETVERIGDRPLVDARPYLPGVTDLGPGPTVQLWPHRHGTDAMFLALVAVPD